MVKGLRLGSASQYFTSKPPHSLEKLLQKMDEYIRSDNDFRQRREDLHRYTKAAGASVEDFIQGMSEASIIRCRMKKSQHSLRDNQDINKQAININLLTSHSTACSERGKGRPKLRWQVQCTSKDTILFVLW